MSFKIKNGVTILSPFKVTGKKILLSNFLKKHSFETINEYNLLYVIQSKNDATNSIYKIGVSSGIWRLREYDRFHGQDTDKGECGGAYLIFLAGQKSPYRKAKTAKAKNEEELKEEYKVRLPWSKRREKQIFKELDKSPEIFKLRRGKEWYEVEKKYLKDFEKIVNNLSKPITKEEYVIPRRSQRNKKKSVADRTRSKTKK